MKHLLKSVLMLACVFSLMLPGCKKYEDGDTFLLLCKMYVVNKWKIEKQFMYNTGADITPANNDWLHLKSDFRYVQYQSDTVASEGNWALDGKKEEFIMIPDDYVLGTQIGMVYTIVRLENKRFRIRSNSTNPIETHYIPR